MDDPLIALFKIGRRAHMEELLHEGHVFMNTVGHFASLDDGSPRADSDEGTRSSRQAEGATLHVQNRDQWDELGTLHGAIRFRDQGLLATNLYCLHGRRRSDYGRVFVLDQLGFGEAYVLLLDANEFFRRLQLGLAAVGQAMSWNAVEYVQPDKHDGPMGVFRKYSERAADREVRVAVSPGSGSQLSVRLGGLSDIALIGDASDRLKLEPKGPANSALEPTAHLEDRRNALRLSAEREADLGSAGQSHGRCSTSEPTARWGGAPGSGRLCWPHVAW
jgi:hypothetical protein